MINPRLEEKLTNALAAGPRSAAAKELFMHGGCHAWAMAAAMQWGGSIRCSTTAIYSNAGRQVLEDCNHAWYEIGGRVADFVGWAENADELLTRYAIAAELHPGFYPTKTTVHESLALTTDQIEAVLAGKAEFPGRLYGEPEWLRRTVSFAREALPPK